MSEVLNVIISTCGVLSTAGSMVGNFTGMTLSGTKSVRHRKFSEKRRRDADVPAVNGWSTSLHPGIGFFAVDPCFKGIEGLSRGSNDAHVVTGRQDAGWYAYAAQSLRDAGDNEAFL